jgi:hypothetical protein
MIIHQRESESIRDESRRSFEKRLCKWAVDVYPLECWGQPPEAIAARVREAVDRALSYGIGREPDVAEFVRFSFELGRNFCEDARYSWVRAILRDPSLDGPARAAAIRRRVFPQ